MKNPLVVATAVATLAIYLGAVLLGSHFKPSNGFGFYSPGPQSKAWRPASLAELPADERDRIEFGRRLFNETPVYLASHVPSRIACTNCHMQGGIAPYASPVVGIVPLFPMFSPRAKRNITLEDRIQECMTRSENGTPLASQGPEMQAMLAYINWLSVPHPDQKPFVGRGLAMLNPLPPNPSHGAEIYTAQCAGCHGTNGEGARRPFPPLWGPQAFNDGAGMNRIDKMAAFIHYNMPQNRKGILSEQDSFDVAAYIQQQPRPAYNHDNDRF